MTSMLKNYELVLVEPIIVVVVVVEEVPES